MATNYKSDTNLQISREASLLSNVLVLILNDIRSAYNVGAMFRSADGCGVKKIYLTGYTQAPFSSEDVYQTRAQKEIAKTALGAEKVIPWEKHEDILSVLQKLKSEKFEVIALEKTQKSVDYKKFVPQFPCALIVGHEIRGVTSDILSQCDHVVHIPMRGTKESLNVSVACGIAIYDINK